MSLTEAHGVFASAHESSINDLVLAICTTRPHLLSYGSPGFVPASSVAESQMSAIGFPGSGGIEWRVSFRVPHLDLYDQDAALAPELTLGPGQFSISTGVELCTDCPRETPKGEKRPERPDRPEEETSIDREEREREERERRAREARERRRGGVEDPRCAFLELQAVGHLIDTWTDGRRAIGFALDAVEIIDIFPNDLESVLECLIEQMLRAALSQIRLPLDSLDAGAFTLTPAEGPFIEIDRVLARGNL
jgi:hypothetical protein